MGLTSLVPLVQASPRHPMVNQEQDPMAILPPLECLPWGLQGLVLAW